MEEYIWQILGGMIFLSFGMFILIRNLKIIKKGIKTKGIVVSHIRNYSTNNSGRSYYEVIQFKDKDGRLKKLKSSLSTSFSYKVGKELEIYYYEDKLIVNSLFRIYMFPLIFILVGIVTTLI